MKGTKGCGKLRGLEPVCQMGGIVDVVDVKNYSLSCHALMNRPSMPEVASRK